MNGLGSSKFAHPDLHRSRIRKDEADIESETNIMNNSRHIAMCPEEVVGISTGDVTSVDTAKGLLGAHQVGEDAYKTFKKTSVNENSTVMNFHFKITQNLIGWLDIVLRPISSFMCM